MPELPDVETYKRYLDATALFQTIEHVRIGAPMLLANATPRGLGRALSRRCFVTTHRHGKYLFAGLDNGRWVVLHFGMTGRLAYIRPAESLPDFTQLLITFSNGFHLAYIAPRKLGRIALTDTPQAFVEKHELGPDALEFERTAFVRFAAASQSGAKRWLLDQKTIAGIGNIYGDEILFQSRLNPRRKLSSIVKPELEHLYRKMRYVLVRAIHAQANPERMPRSWLLPHRRGRGRCPRCHEPLQQSNISSRTTYYCAGCQPLA